MGVKLMGVETIFGEALELPSASERASFLDRACAGDGDLRRQVQTLLDAHFRAGQFLEAPAATPTVTVNPAPLTDGPGTVIGPYKLLEPIGEGGMGVVYMAEQTRPVRRKVALKIVKPGMDTKQVIARFEAERQALALMDHPNIARVLDAGATGSGRPYFVMELVKGILITDYCDRNRLAVDDRLELFVSVCQAVRHAHQKGIIHRDLKPSNVLVTMIDGAAVPKVIDFGVAKAMGQQLTEKTLYTGFAQLIGTPLYMSPEQAEFSGVDVDTRSDTYSLGVLLYELLTGTTPFNQDTFRTAAYDEIRRIIREQEPPRPSTRISSLEATATAVSANRQTDPRTLGKLMRGELDWIVMKALEKDRNRRYETANGLAADVKRYLSDEPVEACPPSTWYRLRKLARRHRAALALAAAVVLGLVVAVSALALSTVVISRGRAEAFRQLAQVRSERRELAAAYFEAAEKVEEFMSSLRNGTLDREALERQNVSNTEKAIEFQEKLAAQLVTDPEGRFRSVSLLLPDRADLAYLKRLGPAEASQRCAISLLTEMIAESPDRFEYRQALQASLLHLGSILTAAGRLQEAEATLRRALDIAAELASLHPPLPRDSKRYTGGSAYFTTTGAPRPRAARRHRSSPGGGGSTPAVAGDLGGPGSHRSTRPGPAEFLSVIQAQPAPAPLAARRVRSGRSPRGRTDPPASRRSHLPERPGLVPGHLSHPPIPRPVSGG